MLSRFDRLSALVTGPLAVVLWVAGIVVGQGMSDNFSNKATDAEVLAWVHDNKNLVIVGSWLFATG